MPLHSKKKGSTYELQVVKFFKDLGYSQCCTSRLASKMMDDKGVDLVETGPFYIQCKAVENLGPVHNVLARMPKEKGKYNVVFHKRSRSGTVVSMSEADFKTIVMLLRSRKLV